MIRDSSALAARVSHSRIKNGRHCADCMYLPARRRNGRDTSRVPSSSEISMSSLAVMHSVNTSCLS